VEGHAITSAVFRLMQAVTPGERMIFMVARSVMKLLAAVVLLNLVCGSALAQDAGSVFLPLSFHSDTATGELRTSACLQVLERQYPDNPWWERTNRMTPAAEVFKQFIAAVKGGNYSAFQELSDASQVKDAAEFKKQATGYFEQAQAFEFISARRAYEFDGLIVFFAGMRDRSDGRTGFSPLVFAVQGQSFKFSPNRTKLITYELVSDWFSAEWGPSGAGSPSYCSDADVKRATHRLSLAGVTPTPSVLLLTGAPLDAPGTLAGVAARVSAAVEAMKGALIRTPDEFARHMTPKGAGQHLKWWPTATEFQRTVYRDAILSQRPFFVFDASPLLVVYTKSPTGVTQVMYFTSDATGALRWTNSSWATSADGVFKNGPLLKSAKLAKPFSDIGTR
jgi:hypothetical protein